MGMAERTWKNMYFITASSKHCFLHFHGKPHVRENDFWAFNLETKRGLFGAR